jgi:hypothetical protein
VVFQSITANRGAGHADRPLSWPSDLRERIAQADGVGGHRVCRRAAGLRGRSGAAPQPAMYWPSASRRISSMSSSRTLRASRSERVPCSFSSSLSHKHYFSFRPCACAKLTSGLTYAPWSRAAAPRRRIARFHATSTRMRATLRLGQGSADNIRAAGRQDRIDRPKR